MSKLKFNATILKFGKQGEKTGWNYLEIAAKQAQLLQPGAKTSFRIMGKLDDYQFKQMALLPMGGGDYILALKSEILKKLGKRQGHVVAVEIEKDESAFEFSEELLLCLNDEPKALEFFGSLPMSHQKYFSKWIDAAKTTETKAKRIVLAVEALKKKKGYGEMIRENKNTNSILK